MRIPKRAVKAMLVAPAAPRHRNHPRADGGPPARWAAERHGPIPGDDGRDDRVGTLPGLGRTVEAAAICRARAQVLLVADDERPDELLADVLDERTAEAWLRTDDGSR